MKIVITSYSIHYTKLYEELFEKANEILGFRITDLMFEGTDEDLKQTKVTQPAIFLHSVILAKTLGNEFAPEMVAGHSLGEFSALVAAGAMSFEDGLKLVSQRAQAMQKACEIEPSTMAAIVGRITSYNVCYTKLLRIKRLYEDNSNCSRDFLFTNVARNTVKIRL